MGAALRIVDRDGLDNLTMRALGRELFVDPMAVYHHLPNKGAILDGVVEAVMREVPLEVPDDVPWQEQLAAFARGYRDALRAHPNAIPAVATRPDVSPAALRILEAALGILLRAGFGPADAVKLMHAGSVFVVGHALDEVGFSLGLDANDLDEGAAAVVQKELESGEYPHLVAAMSASEGVGVDDTFEAGLASLIAGFDARVSPTAPGRKVRATDGRR